MAFVEDSKTQEHPSRASSYEAQSAPQLPDANQTSEEVDGQASNEGTNSSRKPSSSPRRPLTRSQTGTVSKRRRRDDSDHFDPVVPKKRAPQKRQKASPSETESASPEVEDSDSSPKPPTTRATSLTNSTSGSAVPSSGNQITFLHTSVPAGVSAEPRLPRSRANLPTPIPNLTKKSRGRRVPTQLSTTADPDQKATRLYVCTVDGCGKCFQRGEHLKRHIRSIHTHEKPFKCTFSLCQKYFNRHDNLLQHLKVHKDPSAKAGSPSVESSTSKAADSPPRTFPTSSTGHRRNDSYSSVDEPESPVMTTTAPRTIYNAFPIMNTYNYPVPVATTYSTASDSIRLITDMAVSSLRTELPQSPIDSRSGPLQASPY